MTWLTYKEKIHLLSQRIVDAQVPIRVLDAIKWGPEVEQELIRTRFKELPSIGPEFYERIPLHFSPQEKIDEFKAIAKDIELQLGREDPLSQLLITIAEEYIDVVQMLMGRGTKKFSDFSKKLYGSPKDRFYGDDLTILDLGKLLYSIMGGLDLKNLSPDYPETLDANVVVEQLNERFEKYFHQHDIVAKLSDGILADAASGSNVVKIKQGAKFSQRDIDIFEVHEGWVHIATTKNGENQHVAKWLAKGPPRVAATQEGLAVLIEVFTFRTYPRRARQINDRILAIDKVEEGANFLDVMEFYRTEGYSEADCFANAKRVFRGSTLEGGAPFTKDISYCKGFVETYNFISSAIAEGLPQLIPFLFVGKTNATDIPLLYQKFQEGIIDPPIYLPPQFRDLNGLAVWMGFSSFLFRLSMEKTQEHYKKLFQICHQ